MVSAFKRPLPAMDAGGETVTTDGDARPDWPTTFQLVRAAQTVGFGIEWPDGVCTLWMKALPGVARNYPDSRDVLDSHCADGKTQVIWTGQPRWANPRPLSLIN
jgi:hypothetical protein